jgi:hypothetical protein
MPEMVLKYTDVRSYILTLVFVSLSVLTPWAFHQFHLAGPTFLPMHIFVLMAGLVFGWRAGLIVGSLTPLASYAVSGMPVVAVLPQIIIELSVYGMVAGLLRERFNLRVAWSLLGAMMAGRLAMLLAVLVIYAFMGRVFSPLGPEASPFFAVWSAIKISWPGIVIQLASIPAIVWLMGRLTAKTSEK